MWGRGAGSFDGLGPRVRKVHIFHLVSAPRISAYVEQLYSWLNDNSDQQVTRTERCLVNLGSFPRGVIQELLLTLNHPGPESPVLRFFHRSGSKPP